MNKLIFTIILTCFHSKVCVDAALISLQFSTGLNLIRTNRTEDIYLRFYNGSSTASYVQFPLPQATDLFNVVGFQKNNLTTFYAHGYMNNAESDSVLAVASAYIDTKPSTNFVLIDWSNLAQGEYETNAAMNTKPVGLAVAAQISSLVDNGLPLNNINLVGHSLGAHVIGYAGRTLNNTYQKTLVRLTGLDPAFPNFYPDGVLMEHIRATDAQFVDIIHTDAGGYGAPVSTGAADFWPNGGTTHPGCLPTPSSCSHGRAWQFYAESVRTPTVFPASPASSYLQFKLRPSQDGVVDMGYSCPSSARGNYYLTTNAAPPFGKGLNGIQ